MNIYDFKVENPDGSFLDLKDLKGKVFLIVNTATACGFTPQYQQLQEIYDEFKGEGFEIIDIPCNQFRQQAQGSAEEITQFCQLNYGTTFPQRKKSDVNGENELGLYTFLKKEKGFEGFGDDPQFDRIKGIVKTEDEDYENNSKIKWNFTKFLIDREGNVVRRYEPTVSMDIVKQGIKELL